jgi:2-polyprenyl-6-methoxyphenol hydroxylase-like FAD-dependent oxidoreductase
MKLLFDDTDVLVIGGGPVGLTAAISARLKGLKVIVAEGSRPPIDKACGEGVMPDGAAVLESLGVEFDERESFPFHGIRFVDGDLSAEACFPGAHGLGIRRTVLHARLIERAQELGVSLRFGARVHRLAGDTAEVGETRVRFRWGGGGGGPPPRGGRAPAPTASSPS